MRFFELHDWREPRSSSRRNGHRSTQALNVVTSEVERLELRALLGGLPIISISDLDVPAEGNPGQVTQTTFFVTLSETSATDVTVSFVTQNGTATSSPSISNGMQPDFNDATGTLTIPAGETSGDIEVQIVGDNRVEANETFSVVLSDPSGATFSDELDSLTANGTITDDENPNEPVLSVSSPTIIEGNSRTQNVQVIVSVSPTPSNAITYSLSMVNGSATDPSDYQAQNGMRTIPAGQAMDTINIPIVGDRSPEPNESFFVVIQSVTNANVSNPAGTVTIQDSDAGRLTLSVENATATEEDAGTSSLNFPVTLSAASNFDITVSVSLRDGSAVAGQDYNGATITHTIHAGEISDSIAVPIVGDLRHEPDESFSIRVLASRGSNVVVASKRIIGTITDNDPVPTIIIQPSVTVSETVGAARFSVALTNPTSEQVTIDFAFNSGTALQRRDFNARRARLIFAPGQFQGSLSIPIVNDVTVEPTETFSYTITNAVNALIDELASGGIVTINDNDHS
jgi:Calx-beta domain